MLTATWVLAGSTSLLALTSIVAVLTWRNSRRRAAQDQERARADDQQVRILDAARKEFAAKDDVGGLKKQLHRHRGRRGPRSQRLSSGTI